MKTKEEWKQYRKEYHQKNKEEANRKAREYYQEHKDKCIESMTKYRHQARIEAVLHYGGKCECCGESQTEFLAIDHINGGGNKHQKEINGMAIGIWLRKNGYPEGFRVLCHNCNMSLGFMGYCPHKIVKQT